MDNNITSIFISLVKEVRSDIKSIRDTLHPMKADLEEHIRRTALNEARIEELEETLLKESRRQNELLEHKLRIIKISVGIITSLITLGGVVYGIVGA